MLDGEKNSFNGLMFLVKSNQFSKVVLEKMSSKVWIHWVIGCVQCWKSLDTALIGNNEFLGCIHGDEY